MRKTGDIMSKMKTFLELVSMDMGYAGDVNLEVLKEADRILKKKEEVLKILNKHGYGPGMVRSQNETDTGME